MVRLRIAVATSLTILFVGLIASASTSAGSPMQPEDLVPAPLYLHPYGFHDMAISVVAPPATFSADYALGVLTPTTSCLPKAGVANLIGSDFHTWQAYSTSGNIEYVDDKVRLGPSPVLGRGFEFSNASQPILTFYLKSIATAVEAGEAPTNDAPILMPNVVVEITLLRDASSAFQVLPPSDPVILGHGKSTPALLAGPATEGAQHHMVEGEHVYGFEVPITLANTAIDESGFLAVIEAYIETPACTSGRMMPNNVAIHTSPDLRPMIDAAIRNDFAIHNVAPNFEENGGVTIHIAPKSSWGEAGIDYTSAHVTVNGPADVASHVTGPLEPIHYHGTASIGPLEAHLRAETWKQGTYDVNVALTDFTGLRTAAAHASFEVGTGKVTICQLGENGTTCTTTLQELGAQSKATPGPGVGLVIVLVSAAVFVARRHR